MHTPRATLALVLAAVLSAPAAPLAAERSEVPDKYKWNLADLYPSRGRLDAGQGVRWRSASRGSRAYRGHLGDSAEALWQALDAVYGIDRDLSRLVVYAASLSDEDTREPEPREMRQAAEQLAVDFGAATVLRRARRSWRSTRHKVRELPRAGAAARARTASTWTTSCAGSRTPSPRAEERIVAEAGQPHRRRPVRLRDPQGRRPALPDGEALDRRGGPPRRLGLHAPPRLARPGRPRRRLRRRSSARSRASSAPSARRSTRRCKAHVFDEEGAQASTRAWRRRSSATTSPPRSTRQLIADVRRNLPTLHRYLELRQRMMGLDQLRYEDLYVAARRQGGPALHARSEARGHHARGRRAARQGLRGRRSGRASRAAGPTSCPPPASAPAPTRTGVYGVHPYQLLNFNGQYDDVSTLAHESGHSMHTCLAVRSASPIPTADYPIFVAEVASTLQREPAPPPHAGARPRTTPRGCALLGNHLDGLRTTLFRQTLFAEFELAVHEMAERASRSPARP